MALLFSVCMIPLAFSQFDAQVSQYMFHMPAYNPASIGENGMINVTGQYRMQWMGMPGAPPVFRTFSATLIYIADNQLYIKVFF